MATPVTQGGARRCLPLGKGVRSGPGDRTGDVAGTGCGCVCEARGLTVALPRGGMSVEGIGSAPRSRQAGASVGRPTPEEEQGQQGHDAETCGRRRWCVCGDGGASARSAWGAVSSRCVIPTPPNAFAPPGLMRSWSRISRIARRRRALEGVGAGFYISLGRDPR